jgi:hypothetical protein
MLQNSWKLARATAGLDHLHFHDLRHSGNTWAATTGASTRELMARMGHASSSAARMRNPFRVVVPAINSTIVRYEVSGRPRQLIEMKLNIRCSILFHFEVPGG